MTRQNAERTANVIIGVLGIAASVLVLRNAVLRKTALKLGRTALVAGGAEGWYLALTSLRDALDRLERPAVERIAGGDAHRVIELGDGQEGVLARKWLAEHRRDELGVELERIELDVRQTDAARELPKPRGTARMRSKSAAVFGRCSAIS